MSDSLKQAVEGLEAAWRRLREVLDGPDVAAALVERQAVRPMSTAPCDGTWIVLHFAAGRVSKACWSAAYDLWVDAGRSNIEERPVGWSPVK